MRAVGFLAPGGPEVLQVFDVPEPAPQPGHVRIRVAAATVNPSDIASRSGQLMHRYAGLTPPYIPGWDAAGTVLDAGPGTGWSAGDEVVAITRPVVEGGGAYADVISVPAASVVRRPDGADVAAAATLPMNGLTVLQALDRLALPPGAVLAVTGATGAVGGFALTLARAAGLRTVADAAPADRELVTGLGADVVVERSADPAARIREQFPAGVDAVIDGAMLRENVIGAVRDGGGYAALRSPESGVDGVTPQRGIAVHDISVGSDVLRTDRLRYLSDLVSAGRLALRVAEVMPAGQAAEAHRRLAAGGVRGRLVLSFA